MNLSEKRLTKEQRRQINELAAGVFCPQDFECVKGGLKRLCKTKDFGDGKQFECLQRADGRNTCSFALRRGSAYLCQCALRVYLAHKLGRSKPD